MAGPAQRAEPVGPVLAAAPPPLDSAARRELICKVAYQRAAGRHFQPGHDLEDWLQAEQEVDAALARGCR